MKGKILHGTVFLIIAVVTLLLSSCSSSALWVLPPAVTTGLGALHDARTPDVGDTLLGKEAEKIKPGSQIIVILQDGTYVSGEFLGIDSILNEKYDEEYAEIQKQIPEGSFLPSTGDTITLSVKSEDPHEKGEYVVKFLGFDYNDIKVSSIEGDKPAKAKLTYVEKITDKQGKEIEGKAIRNLILEDKFPTKFLSGISIEKGTGEEDEWGDEIVSKKFIDINDINQIQIKNRKFGILVGCCVGTGIDLTILVGLCLWIMGSF